jgi:hypothetical protein
MRVNPLQGRSARLTETTSPELEGDMAGRSTAKTVDELLAQARAMLPHRPSPASLAAATLQQLGLIHATDLDGGFTAWVAAGLPVIAPSTAVGQDRSVNRHLDTSPR